MLVFAFAMAFRMGGRMAWIFLFVVPFLGAGLALVTARTMPLFKKVFRKYDRLNRSVQENIQAMRVVKSFVRENPTRKKSLRRQRGMSVPTSPGPSGSWH